MTVSVINSPPHSKRGEKHTTTNYEPPSPGGINPRVCIDCVQSIFRVNGHKSGERTIQQLGSSNRSPNFVRITHPYLYLSVAPSTVRTRTKRAPRAIFPEYFAENSYGYFTTISQTCKLASHTDALSIYDALLARTLVTQAWRFARFTGSEKSLCSETLSAPFSSTRVKMQTESYSSFSPSTVCNTVETCVRCYML